MQSIPKYTTSKAYLNILPGTASKRFKCHMQRVTAMLLVVNEQLTCQHIFPDKSLNAHTRRIHINLCKEAKTKHRVAISVWLLAKLELCTICCSDGLQLHSMRACIQTDQQYKRILVIGQTQWSLHRGGRSAAGEGHTHLLQVNLQQQAVSSLPLHHGQRCAINGTITRCRAGFVYMTSIAKPKSGTFRNILML